MKSVDHVAKARKCWGDDLPSWVERLAEACNAKSQSAVAKRLGVSVSMISYVVGNKYTGDMERMAEICRGAFERATVDCPALGEIPPATCANWAGRADRLRGSNNQNARMFRACRACPRCKEGKG